LNAWDAASGSKGFKASKVNFCIERGWTFGLSLNASQPHRLTPLNHHQRLIQEKRAQTNTQTTLHTSQVNRRAL